MISNPDDVMDTYSVVVRCEINPTNTADYCKVIARNDNVGLLDRSSKLLRTKYLSKSKNTLNCLLICF